MPLGMDLGKWMSVLFVDSGEEVRVWRSCPWEVNNCIFFIVKFSGCWR